MTSVPNEPVVARFADRTAIVTAASSRVGTCVVQGLLAEGANVVAIDEHEPTFDGLPPSAAERCLAFAADTSHEPVVAAVVSEVARHWPIQHLFNLTDADQVGTSATTTSDTWDRALEVNVRGAFLLCRHVIPRIVAAGGGTIVNVAPAVGAGRMTGRVAYWASKGAMIGLTRALAADHAADGIRINCLCPATAPLAAIAAPGSVAAAALSLAGGDASLTGATLPIAAAAARVASD